MPIIRQFIQEAFDKRAENRRAKDEDDRERKRQAAELAREERQQEAELTKETRRQENELARMTTAEKLQHESFLNRNESIHAQQSIDRQEQLRDAAQAAGVDPNDPEAMGQLRAQINTAPLLNITAEALNDYNKQRGMEEYTTDMGAVGAQRAIALGNRDIADAGIDIELGPTKRRLFQSNARSKMGDDFLNIEANKIRDPRAIAEAETWSAMGRARSGKDTYETGFRPSAAPRTDDRLGALINAVNGSPTAEVQPGTVQTTPTARTGPSGMGRGRRGGSAPSPADRTVLPRSTTAVLTDDPEAPHGRDPKGFPFRVPQLRR